MFYARQSSSKCLRSYRFNYRVASHTEGHVERLMGPADNVTVGARFEEATFASWVGRLNERFGSQFTGAGQRFLDQTRASAEDSKDIEGMARATRFNDFASHLDRTLDVLFIGRSKGSKGVISEVRSGTECRSAAHVHLA